MYSSSPELLTSKYFLIWITEISFDLQKVLVYIYNNLFHCIAFVWNMCDDHLLCGGFLCWLRSTDFSKAGPSERCVLEVSKSWVLLMIPDKALELKEHEKNLFYVTNWKTIFPQTGVCFHLRTTEFGRTQWKAMSFWKLVCMVLNIRKNIDQEQLSCLVLLLVKFFVCLKGCQFFNLSVQKVITSSCIM